MINMKRYRSRKSIAIVINLVGIIISFLLAVGVRYIWLIDRLGSNLDSKLYFTYLTGAVALYIVFSFIKKFEPVEKRSNREIIINTIEQQFLFVASYIILFYFFPLEFVVSRFVIGLFLLLSIIICSALLIDYRYFCVKHMRAYEESRKKKARHTDTQHVYVIGAKSIGLYGGYETFMMNLLQQHADNPHIKYHIANKANGQGCMELHKMPGAESVNDVEFNYYGAHCFMINVPEWAGAAQAIFYDLRALKWVCDHIEKNHIPHPTVYILASRIGPFEARYARRIRKAGGQLLQNPDGHENWRRKWSLPIRIYWKISERYSVKYADTVVCDSKKIEEYIQEEYNSYSPQTIFIPYGSDTVVSKLADDDPKFVNWLKDHNLHSGKYVVSVGRFVPENNYDVMIREFMRSNTDLDYAIITTDNGKFAAELQQKYDYKSDPRIKFVGTVYDAELLAKIRENAAAYIHGHEVGGTNPSLLESMGKTKINLLYDVGFNREVGEDAALYWTKEDGSLSDILDKLETIDAEDYGKRAKQRMKEAYSWKHVADDYEEAFYCDSI